MNVTRRCDYACRILRAAYRNPDEYRSVAQIAEDEEIPYSFARSIQHDLVKGGLLKTVRGSHGGLALNCDPNAVTVLDLFEVLESPVNVAYCGADPESCNKQGDCSFHRVWQGADVLLASYFGSITLAQLLDPAPADAMPPAVEAALSANVAAATNISFADHIDLRTIAETLSCLTAEQ